MMFHVIAYSLVLRMGAQCRIASQGIENYMMPPKNKRALPHHDGSEMHVIIHLYLFEVL